MTSAMPSSSYLLLPKLSPDPLLLHFFIYVQHQAVDEYSVWLPEALMQRAYVMSFYCWMLTCSLIASVYGYGRRWPNGLFDDEHGQGRCEDKGQPRYANRIPYVVECGDKSMPTFETCAVFIIGFNLPVRFMPPIWARIFQCRWQYWKITTPRTLAKLMLYTLLLSDIQFRLCSLWIRDNGCIMAIVISHEPRSSWDCRWYSVRPGQRLQIPFRRCRVIRQNFFSFLAQESGLICILEPVDSIYCASFLVVLCLLIDLYCLHLVGISIVGIRLYAIMVRVILGIDRVKMCTGIGGETTRALLKLLYSRLFQSMETAAHDA